jgi:hypothetical protein
MAALVRPLTPSGLLPDATYRSALWGRQYLLAACPPTQCHRPAHADRTGPPVAGDHVAKGNWHSLTSKDFPLREAGLVSRPEFIAQNS